MIIEKAVLILLEQSQMFQLLFVLVLWEKFVLFSPVHFILPLFYFFVGGAGSDTPISPAVMTLALSIVSTCLELSRVRSAPRAAAAAAAGCLGSNTGKLVNQQDVSPVSCLIGAGGEKARDWWSDRQ